MTNKTPKLITLVGLSGSGKSTYAETFDEYVIVASDKIRETIYGSRRIQDNPALVFEIAHKSIVQNLHSGRNVVFDATNLRSKDRRQLLDMVKKAVPDARCECHVIVRPVLDCVENDSERVFKVGTDVIVNKQLHKFQIPYNEEGWDEIKLIPPEGYYFDEFNLESNCKSFLNQAGIDFDQHTPHHNLTLLEHCVSHERFIENIVCEKIENETNTEEDIRMFNASLLHDYGKLFTHTVDKETGYWHYFGHAEIGAYKLLEHCLRDNDWNNHDKLMELEHLREEYEYEMQNILGIVFYVNYHMLPFDWSTDKIKNKYRKAFGEEKFNNLMLMHEADKQGKDMTKRLKLDGGDDGEAV